MLENNLKHMNRAIALMRGVSQPRPADPSLEKVNQQLKALNSGISPEQVGALQAARQRFGVGMIPKGKVACLTNGLIKVPLVITSSGAIYILLKEKVGHGGFKNVYRAVKIEGDTVEWIARLAVRHASVEALKEDDLAGRINSPFVMGKAYDRVWYRGITHDAKRSAYITRKLFMAQPLMDGDLRDYSMRASVTAEERLDVVLKASKGVRDLHKAGVVHCDLKPANILIKGDEVKVGDLGLASERPLAQGHWRGTPSYLPGDFKSPSFVQDQKTDIYSLGVTLEKICFHNDPSAPSRHWEIKAKAALETLVKEMKDPDPAKRPNIEQVVGRLEAILPLQKNEGLSSLDTPLGSSGTPSPEPNSMVSISLTPLDEV